jgi:hypothetical protein
MASPEPLSERYRQLAIQIGRAQSAVAVTAKALANGDTGLELQAADVLERALDLLSQMSDDSSAMWCEVSELEKCVSSISPTAGDSNHERS